MDPEAHIGLAIIGTGRRAVHLDALNRLGGVRVFALAAGEAEPGAPGESRLQEYDRLISCPQVHAAVICTPLRERAHWVVQAARAGKHVLCESPAASTFAKTRQLISLCAESSVALALVADILCADLETRVRQALDERRIGPLLFVDLEVLVPQSWLRGTREGVLVRFGIPYVSLLGNRFGAIDSICARTRSLGLNRPEEDLVVAQLRYRDGLEGAFQMHGLGDAAQVRLRAYGQRGSIDYAAPLEEGSEPGLRPQYEDFVQAITQGREPSYSAVHALEGMRCLEWIHQAARLDRQIHRNEVNLG